MTTQLYYQRIREKRADLANQFPKGFCLVVSVFSLEKNSTEGTFCEVLVPEAARLMTDGTHRLASEDEAAAYYAAQDVQRIRNAQDTLARTRGQFNQIPVK
jgi:hypothetical protein